MIELVGLAYDRSWTDRIWKDVTAREAFHIILKDEFRKRMDLRSLLYHKGHLELLRHLEAFIREGGGDLSLLSLLARRFSAGIEDFPSAKGEWSFDFQLVRHFASLAMVDDFLTAEAFLKQLLRQTGYLKNGSHWSLVKFRDFEGFAQSLQDVRMNDIESARQVFQDGPPEISYESLVRNFIEFLKYAENNHLTPFFYNSEMDFRHWGDLVERRTQRQELIVDRSMRGEEESLFEEDPHETGISASSVEARLRLQRQRESLLMGLKDPDPLIRQKAAESLGMLSDTSTVPDLVEGLSDDEPEVRQELVRALGGISSPLAEEALIGILDKEQIFSVQLTAAHILSERGSRGALPLLLDLVEGGQPCMAILLGEHPLLSVDRVSRKKITVLAKAELSRNRQDAAYLLRFFNDADAEKELLELLKDEDPGTVNQALYSLWHRKSPALGKTLSSFLSSSEPQLKKSATILEAWLNH